MDQGTQKPQQGIEVQCDEADGDHGSAGHRQFCHDSLQGSLAFGVAEFAFDGDSVLFILPLLAFLLAGPFTGTAQRLAAQADAALLAPGAVGAGLIDLVGVDAGRIVAEALPEGFRLVIEVGRFVVGVP